MDVFFRSPESLVDFGCACRTSSRPVIIKVRSLAEGSCYETSSSLSVSYIGGNGKALPTLPQGYSRPRPSGSEKDRKWSEDRFCIKEGSAPSRFFAKESRASEPLDKGGIIHHRLLELRFTSTTEILGASSTGIVRRSESRTPAVVKLKLSRPNPDRDSRPPGGAALPHSPFPISHSPFPFPIPIPFPSRPVSPVARPTSTGELRTENRERKCRESTAGVPEPRRSGRISSFPFQSRSGSHRSGSGPTEAWPNSHGLHAIHTC